MKLLIIEDDRLVADALKAFLRSNNYAVDLASDGESGFNLADNNHYDLIITDYILPKMNGQEIISRLKENGSVVPILAMSVCKQTENKINLLDKGADDYLTKPFFFTELQARISALLRRRKELGRKIISYKDLELDLLSHEAKRGEKYIYLTTKEFLLLKLLIEKNETIVSRQAIKELAWNEDSCRLSNIIEAYALKLRHKIDFKKPFLIKTIPGRGYKLDASN